MAFECLLDASQFWLSIEQSESEAIA